MTECYTAGQDDWVRAYNDVEVGQVFTPRVSHTLEFIDLQMNLFPLLLSQPLRLYACDATGQPTGLLLSHSRKYTIQKEIVFMSTRVRFTMLPTFVIADQRYIFTLANWTILPDLIWLGNDSTAQTYYPRGWRMHRNVGAPIWTPHYDECFMFCEFGDPPLPKPVPPPPIQNFAITDYAITHWDIGLTIRLPTSVPCHLTCYYTDKQPLKHATSRSIRGLKTLESTYFCFVAWKTVEQTELGDTLYHTFEFPTWVYCQTKWFTFKGKVDVENSPSIGPIFKHHHPGGTPKLAILRPDATGDTNRIPYQTGAPIPNHWENVDEIIPDEDATRVYTGNPWASLWLTDLYHIETATFSKINKVTITARLRRQGGYYYVTVVKIRLKTHGTIYETGAFSTFEYYSNYSWIHETNPYTNEKWTQEEIDNLQIGIALNYIRGVGWGSYGNCTQMYTTIERGIEGGPD